ncbi:MAG TPA: hypothetical protein VN397_01485 [Candidatus Methylomirabilis sp.]|nr:hypothetical protein [Candidatus Methylomirabilis sp.]
MPRNERPPLATDSADLRGVFATIRSADQEGNWELGTGYLSDSPSPQSPVPNYRSVLIAAAAVAVAAFVVFAASAPVFAQQQAAQQVQQTAQAAGVAAGTTDLVQIIGRLINIFLGLLGVIFLVLLLYAGFLWMTSAGDAEKVKKAQNTIKNAVIGLVIIASAWAIVSFIMNALTGVTQPGGGVSGIGAGFGGFQSNAGSLGGGVIESHLPQRNATNVPRNTTIIVTFKKPMKISSLAKDYDDKGTPADLADDTVTEGLNDTAIKIYRTDAGVQTALASDKMRVRFTKDRKTFVFKQVACPPDCLGSPTANVGYTVELRGGKDGVLLENGDLAFGGAFANGYIWQFETGTFLDLTPPKVQAVIPPAGNQYARNVIVQIVFDEAVDPTATTGFVSQGQGFQNIQLHAGGVNTPPVDGEFRISNQYRTVEFIPSELCGKNSCGKDVFCLPGGASIDTFARAATLDGIGPQAQFLQSGYDGVTDVVGNSLDGNADGKTQGPGADDYAWSFGTSNDVNLTPPSVEETEPPSSPGAGQSNIDPFLPVKARFDSILQSSTFNTDNALIDAQEPSELADTFFWQTSQQFLTDNNEPVTKPDDKPAKTWGWIDHRMYASSTEYDPFLLSGIQNLYQNCFNPASSPTCPVGAGGPNCCQSQRQTGECTFP